MSICLIKHFLWLFVNSDCWDYTVQGFSPHKCGQKSCCSAFNAVVAAFPLDISVFLSSPYVLKVYPHRWRLLEDHLNYPGTCLTNIRPIECQKKYSSNSRRVISSDFNPPPFPYVIVYSGASLVIYSSSDASTLSNRTQGLVYKFGFSFPQ